ATEVVTVTGGPRPAVQVWDSVKPTNPRVIELPAARPTGPPGRAVPTPHAVVSPGRKYLAVVTEGQVAVVGLAEGKPAGALKIPPEGQPVSSCHGLAFSPDGSELVGAFWVGPAETSVPRLKAWTMADGRPAGDAELTDLDPMPGLVLGPEKEVVLLGPQVIDR